MASAPQGQVISPDDDELIESEGTLSKIEEADRSHQVATAQKFPRSKTKFRNELKEIVMMNAEVAMEMIYSLPRAGKQLTGPSIRFAEALISCWGNARVGVEVVDVDKQQGYVVAEGRFYDCEKNVGFAIRVRRRNVMTKKDDDSYQVTGMAASSIALRNAIIRGVPKALWEDIFVLAKQTAAGDVKSIQQIREQMIGIFKAIGVTEERLYRALNVGGAADLGSEEILAMRSWHKQLLDKAVSIEDIFGTPEQDEANDIMDALGWPETKRKMARGNYARDTKAMLEHLREEAAKAGIVGATQKKPAAARAAAPVEERQDTSAPSEPVAEAEKPRAQEPVAQQRRPAEPASRRNNW